MCTVCLSYFPHWGPTCAAGISIVILGLENWRWASSGSTARLQCDPKLVFGAKPWSYKPLTEKTNAGTSRTKITNVYPHGILDVKNVSIRMQRLCVCVSVFVNGCAIGWPESKPCCGQEGPEPGRTKPRPSFREGCTHMYSEHI